MAGKDKRVRMDVQRDGRQRSFDISLGELPTDVRTPQTLDEGSLDAFRSAVWALTGLIRVRLRKDGVTDPDPVALEPGATVTDVADWVHHDLGASFSAARVWGPSARFDGQRVGRDHEVYDGDTVEIVP